jgi:hypothetical protein
MYYNSYNIPSPTILTDHYSFDALYYLMLFDIIYFKNKNKFGNFVHIILKLESCI